MVSYDPAPIETMARNLSATQRRMAGTVGRVFAAHGYGPSMQAAAVANAYMESGLDPDAWGDWDERRRTYCSGGLFQLNRCGGAGIGMSREQIEDPVQNTERMVQELHGHFGRPVVRAWTRGERRVGELSRLLCLHLLRPANAAEKADRRANVAEALYPHLAVGTAHDERYGGAAAAWWKKDWYEDVPESHWPQMAHVQALRPDFGKIVLEIMDELRSKGWSPVIVSSWRSPLSQQFLFLDKQTVKRFSFHNISDDEGRPEAIAVDIVDDDHRYGQVTGQRDMGNVPHVLHYQKAIAFFKDLADAARHRGLTIGGSSELANLDVDSSWRSYGLSQDPSHLQMFPYGDLLDYQERAERQHRQREEAMKDEARRSEETYEPSPPLWSESLEKLRELAANRPDVDQEAPAPHTEVSTGGRQLSLSDDGLPMISPTPPIPSTVRKTGWREDATAPPKGESGGGGALAMGLLGLGAALILLRD